MLRAQHMLFSRQCTLHMNQQIHVQVAKEKAEKNDSQTDCSLQQQLLCALCGTCAKLQLSSKNL